MKKQHFAFFITTLFLVYSCKKDNNGEPSLDDVKIASISGIGEFKYQNNKLISIGNEQLLYNTEGKIAETRTYKKDTVEWRMQPVGEPKLYYISEDLEKTSFVWDGDRVLRRIADTLLKKTSSLNSAGTFDPIFSSSLSTNVITNHYYYNAGRLDSVSYYDFKTDNTIKTRYIFDEKGNIVKAIETVKEQLKIPGSFYGGYTTTLIEHEITYDNKPNPFYYLYKQTGIIFNQLRDFNISPNNPLTVKSAYKTLAGTNSDMWTTKTFDYEYNRSGFPTKITVTDVMGRKKTTSIAYK